MFYSIFRQISKGTLTSSQHLKTSEIVSEHLFIVFSRYFRLLMHANSTTVKMLFFLGFLQVRVIIT